MRKGQGGLTECPSMSCAEAQRNGTYKTKIIIYCTYLTTTWESPRTSPTERRKKCKTWCLPRGHLAIVPG